MRAFSVDTNKRLHLTSKDYIDKKRNETIYSIEANLCNKKDCSNEPIRINNDGHLEKIGGFDVESYKMYNMYINGCNNLKKKCSKSIIDDNNITYQISQSQNYVVTLDTSGVFYNTNDTNLDCELKNSYYDLSYVNLVL